MHFSTGSSDKGCLSGVRRAAFRSVITNQSGSNTARAMEAAVDTLAKRIAASEDGTVQSAPR